MTRRLRFGMFPKVLLTMLGVAVIPLSAIWYLNYSSAIGRLSGQVDQQLGDRADSIVSYVDAWVDMNVKMLRQNAALDDIITMDPKRQRRTLLSIVNEYKAIYLAFTIAPDGSNIGRSDQEAPKNFMCSRYSEALRWVNRS